MMRERWVMGNWKMHGSLSTARSLAEGLAQQYRPEQQGRVAVFPPAVHLAAVADILAGTSLAWGGQNAHEAPSGAYTGEISMTMLKDLGCSFVLLGHSERRRYFGEHHESLERKLLSAAEAGLRPVLCLGETAEERHEGRRDDVLASQLLPLLKDHLMPVWPQLILAYEPVWAIGTGISAAPEDAQSAHACLREIVSKKNLAIAENLTILYGGSVKPSNAAELFSMPDIDGALVGAASLVPSEFLEIAQCGKRLS